MGKIKRYRRFRIPKQFGIPKIFDPKDGLNINTLKWGGCISVNKYQMSMYDSPNMMEYRNGRTKPLGIMKKVGQINMRRSLSINPEIGLLNKGTF